jgi:hypothetical protein
LIDPSIRPGKDYVTSFSVQRELPKDMLLEAAFVGRYARNLPVNVNLEQAPYMQLDQASRQTFAQAFDNVATALRNGATVTPQPWFENQVPGGTLSLASAARSNFINGNVNSVFTALDTRRMAAGLAPFNNYMAQATAMRTGLGFSNYNGLLVTLRKRLSRGLIFDLNYTFAHSLDSGDNQLQNGATLMPNNFHLGTTYGPSSFDITHIFSGRWFYELPFHFSNVALNKVIGGWFLSGIFMTHSGSPLLVAEGTQAWGGSLTLTATSGAVPTVSPSTLGRSVHRGVTVSAGAGTNGNPATGGSGLNLFANPQSAFSSFRPVLLASDGREGRANPLRGLPFWNLDSSLGKKIPFTERISAQLAADFFNIFNNVNFLDPTLSLTSPQTFGVITSQLVPANRSYGSRAIQLSLRVEF